MIGLQFLINIYGFKNKDIAEKLEISPVTVHDWIKGKRKIPQQRINELKNVFKYIPQKYFQKELTEIDKLKIQNTKLHREMCSEERIEQMCNKERDRDRDREIEIELEESDLLLIEVENKLEYLELQEAMKFVKENIDNMSKKGYADFSSETYLLKTFFDISNSEGANLIRFYDILYFIAKYLNIEGYRDEDEDDGLEYTESPLEHEREAYRKIDYCFEKKLSKLLDEIKLIQEEYKKAENKFWNS
ncbi:hypothetical protein HYH85_02610 [Clostridium botulinum]|uniref:helix-turn-helix domain-containing protein n=1 Tax=Clostridium botulinum TaxID=1491 RepID=UPI001C9A4D6F|nr:helix-turn-helix domain-containing protein [Clostridium botulinum]MBY6795171.1 hypothetical protein [Clostridium botulinum]MBY6865895.1 hypothetical protein [Clostridium botulinum]